MIAPRHRTRGTRNLFAPTLVLALVAAAASLALLLAGPSGVTPNAAGQSAAPEVTPQTDAAVPARGVMMLGSAPREAPGETWGIGQAGSLSQPRWAIVRYSDASGWSLEAMLDRQGRPLTGFAPVETSMTGEIAAGGAGVIVGLVSEEVEAAPVAREALLVRNPGGSFQEVEPPPAALLRASFTLTGRSRAPLLAALDEGEGRAGAFVVPLGPSGTGVAEDSVLHWDGRAWTSEPVEVPGTSNEGFRVLAIDASSTSNAWLLGELPSGGVALFRRAAAGGSASWKPVVPSPGGTAGEALSVGGESLSVSGEGSPPSVRSQLLTVTDEGVWIDGERAEAHAALTLFFKPDASGERGQVAASWCDIPAGAPPGTLPCTYTLPGELPSGSGRSFAWDDPSEPYGQRVIAGLPEDVTLRLEGNAFTPVLALGAGESSTLGAAFSEPREGWLGDSSLPVHLTIHPFSSELQPYPAPFRFALLAVAPQPGAPVGASSSEALAVGDFGEVARFAPGQGWQPESLLGAGGRRATPRLRAVAWPTQGRAFAVGELGQMWLWRSETGLWERDPAAPRNFRGDLLGIAFDPSNAQRGFAVGQQGVLLRYGKSWQQEQLPPEVATASFTSITFAGSEAIVAFRVPHPQSASTPASYSAGLLVNSGSGWHVDGAAASALGSEGIPWAVAGLPDGGAALSGEELDGEPLVLERDSAGGDWKPTAAPYPGFSAPGSIALFREGGGSGPLRVIGAGAVPNTREVDFFEPPVPSGFPENLVKPYPPATGHVLRQTADGWSDEEHDRNESARDPGNYAQYDLPFEPDPTAAVLTGPTGSAGWAVGGQIDTATGRLDTADIARYPAESAPPPGAGSAPITADTSIAVFAVAGDAQCAAPCAARANDRLGPDLWLQRALAQAGQIQGVRGFLYLGPRVTSGKTLTGKVTKEVPYQSEFARYAQLLRSSPVPAYPVASSTDVAGAAGECQFVDAFEDFPAAISRQPPGSCAPYYAFESEGPGAKGEKENVRVIVLDTSTAVAPAQLAWLQAQLGEASAIGVPAIVLGDADLAADIAAREPWAGEVVSALVKPGGASAYFFDSPERNIRSTLAAGSESIPSFGTGSLGYINAQYAAQPDFIGHSGFLLAEVQASLDARDAHTLRWPVAARLIPNVGELALEAQDGTLLRRSQAALFDALARRPRAGCLAEGGSRAQCESTPYVPIPANCVGVACAAGIFPEYTFSSSNPAIGDFVKPNLAANDPRAVLLGPEEKPIHDEQSSLFCAYNPGTTVVTISAGGLSSSLTVTVQAGSVRRPCGTVPATPSPTQSVVVPSSPPAPVQQEPGAQPTATVPLAPPAPPAPLAQPRPQPPLSPFLLQTPAAPVLAFVPPPVPTPARPTPPSGTSAVTSPVEVAQEEEEQEEAPESVSNQAVAYHPQEHGPAPEYLLGLIVIAAFAGSCVRRRPRSGPREARLARALVYDVHPSRWRARRAVSKW